MWLPLTVLVLALGLLANIGPFRKVAWLKKLLPILIMVISVGLLLLLTVIFWATTFS